MSFRTVITVCLFYCLAACESLVPGAVSQETRSDESGRFESSQSALLADGGWADVEVYGPGNTLAGWEIYDPIPDGGRIEVVVDSVRGSVNQFTSTGTDNGFRLRKADLKPWGNTTNFNLSWWQNFSTPYTVYVDVNTTDGGQRYITYTGSTTSSLGDAGYIHHGIGNGNDGLWHIYQRDLQRDLRAGIPNLTIQSVNGFLIRGTGRTDDITLQKAPFSPPTITALTASATDVFWGNAVNLSVTATPANAGDKLTYQWTATQGTLSNPTSASATWVAPSVNTSAIISVTVFGPNGLSSNRQTTLTSRQSGFAGTTYTTGDSLSGWSIYDNDPADAGMRIVATGTTRGNVIDLLGGANGVNGFQLRFPAANTKNFTITWETLFTAAANVYVDIDTTEGQRYLMYTLTDRSPLGYANYVEFGLGSVLADGQWHSMTRDLQADYRQAYPMGSVLSVKSFLVRGFGKVDTVRLGAPVCQ